MLPQSIVFIHPTLTHYHYPRLRALGAAAQGARVTNLEIAGSMQAYPWGAVGQAEAFQNMTLFPGCLLEDIPASRQWAALRPRLGELQPEVVFLYGYSLDVFRRAKLWCDQHGAATVLISDSNAFDKPRSPIFELMKSLFVRRYNAAFVGGTSSSRYIQTLGIPPERVVDGYDVIDVTLFASRAAECRGRVEELRQKWGLPGNYFLVVARLIPEKNLPGLLAAYAQYFTRLESKDEPWHLVLCGSGPEEQALRAMLADFPEPVRAGVHLPGYVRQPEVIDFFAAAGCLVLPSLSESWGLVVNEALACSLPVLVSSRVGCACDLVQEGSNGWTFDPQDRDTLAGLLARMAALDPGKRAEMGRRGRELIANWDLDRFASGALECARIAINHNRQSAHRPLARRHAQT
jgi:1,2-diacylglycerol 3-alpha-glucosyltransferase